MWQPIRGALTGWWAARAQVGYQITVAKFFTYFLLMSLMMLISETLGMLCAGLCRSELVGAIVLQGLYVPLLIFTGFFQARLPICVNVSAAFSVSPDAIVLHGLNVPLYISIPASSMRFARAACALCNKTRYKTESGHDELLRQPHFGCHKQQCIPGVPGSSSLG